MPGAAFLARHRGASAPSPSHRKADGLRHRGGRRRPRDLVVEPQEYHYNPSVWSMEELAATAARLGDGMCRPFALARRRRTRLWSSSELRRAAEARPRARARDRQGHHWEARSPRRRDDHRRRGQLYAHGSTTCLLSDGSADHRIRVASGPRITRQVLAFHARNFRVAAEFWARPRYTCSPRLPRWNTARLTLRVRRRRMPRPSSLPTPAT